MDCDTSLSLYRRACELIPGGVNSPVRAFGAVGGNPLFLMRGEGARVWDVDGNEFIDYVGSWGPLILGHAHPEVVEAIAGAARYGSSFGAPTAAEVELAELILERLPLADKVRLVNSGTEATLTALRIARGYTGRDKIVKFNGCYHGHADSLLVQAGSGAATLGVPDSAGVPASVVANTLTMEFNDLEAARQAFASNGGDIAAVIVEPVCGNAGVIPPGDGFLPGLRQLCRDHGTLLIFDEVMTGFRVAPGSAQALYRVEPDLTTLGKIIGGGMPIGAVAGRREIMESLAPSGPVYQAGTLSGNPVAVAAGIATLKALGRDVYDRIEALSERLRSGIETNIAEAGTSAVHQRVASMHCLFFTDRAVRCHADAKRCDTALFGRYFREMLEHGVYLPPSQFETFFVSVAHTEEDIDATIEANLGALRALR